MLVGFMLIVVGFILLTIAKHSMHLIKWYDTRPYKPSSMVFDEDKQEFRDG